MTTDIMSLGRDNLGRDTSIDVDIVETPEDLAWDFALTMARIIKTNNESGRHTTMVRKTIHGPVTPRFPAAYLQTHPNVRITITEDVARTPDIVPK